MLAQRASITDFLAILEHPGCAGAAAAAPRSRAPTGLLGPFDQFNAVAIRIAHLLVGRVPSGSTRRSGAHG
jgi:hypothetical protein